MARRNKTTNVGASNKQNKSRKGIGIELLKEIDPITENQKLLYDAYENNKNIVAHGCAGTGKTFITLFNALEDVLSERTPYDKIYIVRSLVATRDIGFMPGDYESKSALYQTPYKSMVQHMFNLSSEPEFEMLYGNLKTQGTITFWSTSFSRGTTIDNAIIIVDEMQNLSFHELDSIVTRVGENSKIMFCGDATQSDLTRTSEKNGIMDFMKIIRAMPSFDIIEFGVEDICRSSLVKEYLIAKYSLNLDL